MFQSLLSGAGGGGGGFSSGSANQGGDATTGTSGLSTGTFSVNTSSSNILNYVMIGVGVFVLLKLVKAV